MSKRALRSTRASTTRTTFSPTATSLMRTRAFRSARPPASCATSTPSKRVPRPRAQPPCQPSPGHSPRPPELYTTSCRPRTTRAHARFPLPAHSPRPPEPHTTPCHPRTTRAHARSLLPAHSPRPPESPSLDLSEEEVRTPCHVPSHHTALTPSQRRDLTAWDASPCHPLPCRDTATPLHHSQRTTRAASRRTVQRPASPAHHRDDLRARDHPTRHRTVGS